MQHPGFKRNFCCSFSMFHWNLNSLPSQFFLKVSLLRSYLTINKFDIVCISETYLNFSTLSNNGNLDLPGYMTL